MKNNYSLLILFFVGFLSFSGNAQSVSLPQAALSAAPMGTVENGGFAIASVEFAEASGAPVPATSAGQPNVTISVNLQFVELADADTSQITGSLLEFFDSSYNIDTNILVFTQTDEIPGDWFGQVEFRIDVIQNSTQAEAFNGFNANITAIDSNTNADGNISIFTYTDENVLFVAENTILTYTILPNPAQDFITITIDNNFATKVEVFDLTGKAVLQEAYNGSSNKFTLNISELAPAVYLLKVTSNDATVSTRIIKE